MAKEKKRLDAVLVERGLVSGREKAKALILSGDVLVNGMRADKAGTQCTDDDKIEILAAACPYVSRGGYKLEKAVNEFGISLEGRICADIGASTGGFTDVMLKNGAKMVYSIDVGYGQLDWSLRNDERVVVMERTNARHLEEGALDPAPEFAGMDVSFISIRLILPALKRIGIKEVAALIKPQFEAGKENVGKKGVVRDPETHKEVLDQFVALADQLEFKILGLTFSPVKGPEGNIEFLGHLTLDDKPGIRPDTAQVVADAHATLKG